MTKMNYYTELRCFFKFYDSLNKWGLWFYTFSHSH